ncbi:MULTISPECIES: alpha/beta fold hydrolase [Ectothiorhodospira]|uniref:alpha/beta fold hydrolase n=1 Tax=Ectothiorhodospira TaxID=1051 RepID=UPI001EE91324|nr:MULTISPECIES: alpha/beta hydrolase [Ectothiorhodospira]MCG5493626.1 alpha/beta hydrolase [Ectothiorhodospira variabilis]MCG5502955.1 alpha/beta hydrolase [Ectothiorhodospira variabilis]MCG5506257.1 alpha/beta hydrolase [Ectothiorhodospira variabilis]MCG5525117.1 alpha/beta hydrolase [Ectothiorhodospira haloalkaliphila]
MRRPWPLDSRLGHLAGIALIAGVCSLPWSSALSMETERWTAPDGTTLREAVWHPDGQSLGTLILLPGYQEFAEKYDELAHWAAHQGWRVRLLEWRGQGLSERPLADPHRAHHDDFGVAAADLLHWMADQAHQDPGPRVILAHSLGAHLALRALVDGDAGAVDALILSAPMLLPNTGPYPVWLAERIARLAVGLGLGEWYALGQGPYDPKRHRFASNPVTGSLARWSVHHDHFREQPELALGGVTWGWLDQALRSRRLIKRKAADTIQQPVLLLSAPADRLVVAERHPSLCDLLTRCTLIRYPGARHELLMEEDRIRDRVLGDVLGFLEAQSSR